LSKKLKPNFTPIPNVVFDSMMREIASGPLRVLLAICRYTYGWGKESDRISLGQLAEMTNMDRSNVHRAVKQLGPLVIVKPGDPSKNQSSEYRLNIEISDADLVSLRQQGLVSLRQQPVVRPVVTSATIQRYPKKEDKAGTRVPESSPIPKGRKLTRPGQAQLEAFTRFYSAYPRHVDREAAQKAWLRLSPSPELIAEIMAGVERYAETVKDTELKYVKHPGPWLNARRWEDEPVSGNGNGHGEGPPKIIKREGGMLTLADGSIMPAGTYQRKYGISP